MLYYILFHNYKIVKEIMSLSVLYFKSSLWYYYVNSIGEKYQGRQDGIHDKTFIYRIFHRIYSSLDYV